MPWTSVCGFHKDKDAFLFHIRSSNELEQKECPFMFEVEDETDEAVYHGPYYGPSFGSDIFIRDNCNDTATDDCDVSSHVRQKFYNYGKFKGILCGGNLKWNYGKVQYCFQVLEYEVFQIQ